MTAKLIDLRSDTVTKPSLEMLAAVQKIDAANQLGDDVFGEDALTNGFERLVAEELGKEAALFVPSGTMANQLGIKLNTSEGDEVICDAGAHIFNYETAAPAFLSRVQLKAVEGENGVLTLSHIKAAMRPVADWYPRPTLVALENTHNRAGGSVYPIAEIARIAEFCKANGLRLHLDGARLWNACVASETSPKDYAQFFDTISVCFSKGLGAPIGSMILGAKSDIARARRLRKMWGGGMRQIGIITAMAKFAFEKNYARLRDDHIAARRLAEAFAASRKFKLDLHRVQTNILAVDISPSGKSELEIIEDFKRSGVLIASIKENFIRLVTHLDVSASDIERVCNIIHTF
jgi:threonine aldolase